MAIDDAFYRLVSKFFDPYSVYSGTEHVAPFLYSLIRMTRPEHVIEVGSGYTTPFLVRALADNVRDAEAEPGLLLEKSKRFAGVDLHAVTKEDMNAWLGGGGIACGVDPAYYLKPHRPKLYAFDQLAEDQEYSVRLRELVSALGHTDLVTWLQGRVFDPDAVPKRIDFAWNDDIDYRQFFEAVWPALNPNGGTMVFHNVLGFYAQHLDAVEWIKAQHGDTKHLEIMLIREPHKMNQNSCAILRKIGKEVRPYDIGHPEVVHERLEEFLRSRPG